MNNENHLYGHASILHEYCGYTEALLRPIHGIVQHGWMPVPREHVWLGRFPLTKFLWSQRLANQAVGEGWRDLVPIGAPFLYLLQLHPAAQGEREGTIVYPWHGLPWALIEGDHRQFVDEVLEVEDGPVTFCLHPHDYQQEAIRRVYERDGVRVIANGRKINLDLDRPGLVDMDRTYLTRQLAELRRHRRVVSNRLTTAILYGAAAGNEVGVYGSPMRGGAVAVDHTWLERTFPELHAVHADSEVAREVADRELGRDQLRAPEDLRKILGWEAGGRRPSSGPVAAEREGSPGARVVVTGERVPDAASDSGRVEVCAYADELIHAPDLLRAWASEFTAEDPVVLLIYPGFAPPETVVAELLDAMAAAGLSNSDDEAQLVLLQGDTMPSATTSQPAAIYTRSPTRAAATGLMRLDDSALAAIRWSFEGASRPWGGAALKMTVGRTSVFAAPPEVISPHTGAELTIGEYCSIGAEVRFILNGEPRLDLITTALAARRWGRFALPDHPKGQGEINVHNDVWVADGATILSDVTIATGAVIGASSVVTEDVRPYAVVAGNPAREIKRRFSDRDCELLLGSQWWDLAEGEVRALFAELGAGDVGRFVSAVDNLRARGR